MWVRGSLFSFVHSHALPSKANRKLHSHCIYFISSKPLILSKGFRWALHSMHLSHATTTTTIHFMDNIFINFLFSFFFFNFNLVYLDEDLGLNSIFTKLGSWETLASKFWFHQIWQCYFNGVCFLISKIEICWTVLTWNTFFFFSIPGPNGLEVFW